MENLKNYLCECFDNNVAYTENNFNTFVELANCVYGIYNKDVDYDHCYYNSCDEERWNVKLLDTASNDYELCAKSKFIIKYFQKKYNQGIGFHKMIKLLNCKDTNMSDIFNVMDTHGFNNRYVNKQFENGFDYYTIEKYNSVMKSN